MTDAASTTPILPTLHALRADLEHELTHGILPYWMTRARDDARGGFFGLIDEHDAVQPDAPKGGILHARILWTFAAAHRLLGGDAYLATAAHALDFLRRHLTDPVHGGVYWMVEADGGPSDTRKHVYAQAFAIYALSEHARATGDARSLREAVVLFGLVERHAHDTVHGGYEEAFSRDWVPLDDVRLGATDANERRSMNTHLHVLEAYTNLYRVWPDPVLRTRLVELLELFCDRIVDGGHMRLFFDAAWTPRSTVVSYGHDIEASWLLLEAAEVVGDEALRARVQATSVALAAATLGEATDPVAGGIFYETTADGTLVTEKEWWPQAEAIVGFVAAHEATGRAQYLRAAAGAWEFTRRHLVDREHGEWFRAAARDGARLAGHEKAGPWKCPYHNARACLEIIERHERIARGETAGHEPPHESTHVHHAPR